MRGPARVPGSARDTEGELLPSREPLRTIFRSIGLVEQAIGSAA